MTLDQKIFAIVILLFFFSAILYVFFGQFTMRRLRKNPETKAFLGLEFMSGWDILNVAQSLSLPRRLTNKLEHLSGGVFDAKREVIEAHVSGFEIVIARLMYWSSVIMTVLALIGLGVYYLEIN